MAKWMSERRGIQPDDPKCMPRPTVQSPKMRYVREWKCDGCGEWFTWGEGSSYHGSIKLIEDGDWDKVFVACSAACYGKHKA